MTKISSSRPGRFPDQGAIGYAKSFVLVLLCALTVAGLTACGVGGTAAPPATQVPMVPAPTEPPIFDGQRAYQDVLAQVAFGPHPVATAALDACRAYIEGELQKYGWDVTTQDFVYQDTPIHNVLARKSSAASDQPRILIGAHYDTRPRADMEPTPDLQAQPILGANDGASGVAVLLEFARVYDPTRSNVDVTLAFFDAEDMGGIDGWPFSVGATAVADDLSPELSEMILLDMVGDADQRFPFEATSTPALAQDIWDVAAELGYGEQFVAEPGSPLLDDHRPFLMRGVPAVDIIDFDYPYWHTLQDTADKVSAASLERVGRVVLEYVYTR